MLTVHQLAKTFALKTLFKNITFSIDHGDRVGLVGPNGSGKTTLLRIITGAETADNGHVNKEQGLRIGYLSQGLEAPAEESIGALIGRAAGDAEFLEAELQEVAKRLMAAPGDLEQQDKYDDLLRRISAHKGGTAPKVLKSLQLDQVPAETLVGSLSGGQQTRLNLALVLLEEPQLLLLDEPTNHLDITMLEWLETWLSGFQGGALIVSHDRTFLDNTVNRILALDPLKQEVREFAGNYSDYRRQLSVEREKQWAAYRDQQLEERRIKEDILKVKAQAAYTERQASSISIGGEMMKLKGYKDYQQGIAKKVAKKAKSRERKLDRFLDSEDRVEKPRQKRNIRLDFAESEHLGRSVVSMRDLSIGYEEGQALLANLNLDTLPGDRIVMTGPNGCGKTTLLKTLAGRMPPLQGDCSLGPSVELGFMTQDQSDLDLELTPLTSIREHFPNETKARTFLGYFLFSGDEPLLNNKTLSYGQRARLSLAKLVATGCNVLLLDEPTNHLDIPSREKFEEALNSFDGTIIAVIHDRYFIERFASEIWVVEGNGIRRIVQ